MSKKKAIPIILLFLYIGFIIYTTLLCREPTEQHQYNFTLSWSHQRFFDKIQPQGRQKGRQIVNNILFFIPFGALMFLYYWKWEKRLFVTVGLAFLLSGIIETLQLFLKLGFAEFDDAFDNTLGAAVGSGLVLSLSRLIRK